MKKKIIVKALIMLSLAIGLASMPAMMSGAPIPNGSSKDAKTTKAEKKRIARKERALSVLREYLPRYADILETEMVRFEDAFYGGSSLLPIKTNFDARSPFTNPFMRLQLMQVINDWLGTRYRFGGRSKAGVDCSGFTSKAMTEALGHDFIGSSRVQAAQFSPIISVDSLQFGDIIFFTGTSRRSNRIGHVGIYLGNGVFAHSSTSVGVTFNHLSDGYYSRRYRFGGRFTNSPASDIERAGVYAHP
ncbi:MAG: C40 family peptidase [Bacteroidetes bacterium]|nr:C40 family peptidase [Bacteroidota bacterium]